jgi:diguanylate cyclase (GGDEF)-like protein
MMVDWGKLPDLGAVALLTTAFATVARRSQTAVSSLWLTGWIMIAIHFAALLFAPMPGAIGSIAVFIGLAALTWAGVLFMLASVSYRKESSKRWMVAALLFTYTLYVGLAVFAPAGSWTLIPAALFFGIAPLAVALLNLSKVNHPLRWATVTLHLALAAFLLAFQMRPGNGAVLALNAVFFTVYFGCCLHVLYAYRQLTAGAFITTAGFLAWAAVFVAAPGLQIFLPSLHLESEVWNLPKYVVAIGMILLILEEQIEHNKHLALHDELTGLPNRRLFQDRLASALERARRSGSHVALLLVDLDHFKQVNDTVGHHIGDLVLQQATQIFLDRVRRSDTVARTGGDEFSIILEEPTSRDEAEYVARSLIQLLKQPLQVEGHMVQIGASVGIAVFPEDAVVSEALRIAADLRMYERKYQARATEVPYSRPLPVIDAQSGMYSSSPAPNPCPR